MSSVLGLSRLRFLPLRQRTRIAPTRFKTRIIAHLGTCLLRREDEARCFSRSIPPQERGPVDKPQQVVQVLRRGKGFQNGPENGHRDP